MNHLISYPRSGRTLYELRMFLYLVRVAKLAKASFETSGDFVSHSHLSYNGIHGINPVPRMTHLDTQSEHFYILMRDTSDVVASFYRRLWKDLIPKNPWFAERYQVPENFDDFVFSPMGMQRVIDYYSNVEKLVESGPAENFTFLYHEDSSEIDSVDLIPSVLGFDKKLTASQRMFLYHYSKIETIDARRFKKKVVGAKIYDYLNELRGRRLSGEEKSVVSGLEGGDPVSAALQDKIKEMCKESISFKPYRDRYLLDK